MQISKITHTSPIITFSGNSGHFRQQQRTLIENNIELTPRKTANINELAQRFEAEGLTLSQVQKAAKGNPFLFVQKPETVEKNIRGAAKKFERFGVTVQSHLKSALAIPALFSISPERLENNIKKQAQLFAYDGLSIKDLFTIAKNLPQIYILSPNSLNKKVNAIAKGINIERSEVLEIIKKQPIIFALKPKEVIKKYEFLKYVEENKYFDTQKPLPSEDILKQSVLKKSFTNSMELNNPLLLKNKIFAKTPRNKRIPSKHVKENLQNYLLQNNKKIIEFSIPENKLAKDFIKFAKDFSKSVVGKNIFRIKVV